MRAEVETNSQWLQKLQTPVAVLLGGHSAEREISLQSGEAVLGALQANNIDAVALDTAIEGWLDQVASDFKHCFIALHGGDGEDGTAQQALEKMNISYTGSGVIASSLAMDKVKTKNLWRDAELPTPDFIEVNETSDWDEIIQNYGKVIVKPTSEGSSIGMAIASSVEELSTAYKAANLYDCKVMVEQWIQGSEFTVAILGRKALPAIRLETDHGFYDYDAKYISDNTRYICPCGLTIDQEKELQQLAIKAFDSVGCQGWGRVDFMQDEEGNFFLLEINTVPGMTSHSLVPMAAKADGLSFETLVLEILRLSVI